MLEAAPRVDNIILLSGDGDFDRLLDKVHNEHAVTTEVYGVAALTANSLIEACQQFHPVEPELLL